MKGVVMLEHLELTGRGSRNIHSLFSLLLQDPDSSYSFPQCIRSDEKSNQMQAETYQLRTACSN